MKVCVAIYIYSGTTFKQSTLVLGVKKFVTSIIHLLPRILMYLSYNIYTHGGQKQSLP